MANIDLTQAIEAGLRATSEPTRREVEAILTAALPVLRAALAEQVEAERDRIRVAQASARGAVPDEVIQILAGYDHAARIIRGGAS